MLLLVSRTVTPSVYPDGNHSLLSHFALSLGFGCTHPPVASRTWATNPDKIICLYCANTSWSFRNYLASNGSEVLMKGVMRFVAMISCIALDKRGWYMVRVRESPSRICREKHRKRRSNEAINLLLHHHHHHHHHHHCFHFIASSPSSPSSSQHPLEATTPLQGQRGTRSCAGVRRILRFCENAQLSARTSQAPTPAHIRVLIQIAPSSPLAWGLRLERTLSYSVFVFLVMVLCLHTMA